MNQEQALHKAIALLSGKWLDFLKSLIQEPSVTGDESRCLDLVRGAMLELGVFERDVYPENNAPFTPTGRDYAQRGCVVGRLCGTEGASFILNAHLDTAPVENPASWEHSPFSATLVDNKLFGRGALDDKAGVAMLLLITEAFQHSGITLPGDLILEVVIEDEDSGNGTLACTLAGYQAEAGIIIDGTWPFRLIDAHLGQLWLDVIVDGRPTAACSHERGSNPILLALRVIERMRRKVDACNARGEWCGIADPYFLNVGSIHSGVWAGSVPETCQVSCQLGFAPPETTESVLAMVQSLAQELAPDGKIRVVPGPLCTEPFMNRGNHLSKILCQTITRLRPAEMEVTVVAVKGHCDLRHLRKPDGTLADACLYGPGGGGNPHARDEFYQVDHFTPVAQNIASAILAWSGVAR